MMLVFVVILLNAIVLVLVIRLQGLSALLKNPDRFSWGPFPRENVKQIQGKTAALPFTTYLLKVIPPQMFYSCFGNEDIICHSLICKVSFFGICFVLLLVKFFNNLQDYLIFCTPVINCLKILDFRSIELPLVGFLERHAIYYYPNKSRAIFRS